MQVKLNKILLASVSHEFWNPLNAVQNNANQILQVLGVQYKGLVKWQIQIISSCCSMMLSLIEDILDNAKLD